MATNNSSEFDISCVMFKPINSQKKRSMHKRKHPYKSAQGAPAISCEEEWVAPYAQVTMSDRWANDCKSAKVAPVAQVPMYERWSHDRVG